MLDKQVMEWLKKINKVQGCDCYIRVYPDNSGAIVEALSEIELFSFNSTGEFFTKCADFCLVHYK